MKKRYNIYLDQNNVEDLRYLYPEFNLSDFVDKCIRDFLLDGEEVINPVHMKAKQIAIKRMKERAEQQKLIEEARSYEQLAREMKERDEKKFREVANQLLEDPDRYIKFLPEFSSSDTSDYWERKAKLISNVCSFPVTVESVQTYVREVCNV